MAELKEVVVSDLGPEITLNSPKINSEHQEAHGKHHQAKPQTQRHAKVPWALLMSSHSLGILSNIFSFGY